MKNRPIIILFIKRCGWIFIQLAASLMSVGAISLILLLIYLSLRPLHLDFLFPYVKPHLEFPSLLVSYERASLTWREWNHPFELQLENLSLHLSDKQEIHIPHLVIHLNLLKALQGKIVISKATLLKTSLPLGSEKESASLLSIDDISKIFDPSFLEGFKTLTLEETSFHVPFCEEPLIWPGLSLTVTRKKNILRIEAALKKKPFIKGEVRFSSPENTLHIATKIDSLMFPSELCRSPSFAKVFSGLANIPFLSGSFEGVYNLKQKNWLKGKGLLTQRDQKPVLLSILGGELTLEDLEAQIFLKNDTITLDYLSFKIDGLPLKLQGNLNQKTQKFSGNLESFDTISLPLLSRLWPETVAPNPREWLFKNIKEGSVKEIFASGTGRWEGGAPLLTSLSGHMLLEGMRVSYLEGMPVVMNACGKAEFDTQKFFITLTKGVLDQQTLQKGTILLGNLDQGNEYLKLDVQLQGPIQNAISIIDNPPLEYARQLDIQPDSFQGTVSSHLKLNFPLKKDLLLKEVNISVDSHLTNVAFSTFIEKTKIPLTLKNGTLNLKVTGKTLALKGKAEVNKRAAQVFWEEAFGPQGSRLYGLTTPMTPAELLPWDIDLREWVVGPFDVSLTYHVPREKKASSFLKLQTYFKKTTLDLPFLSWRKPAGEEGHLSTSVEFDHKGKILLKDLHFKAKNIKIAGRVVFSQDKSLELLDFSQMQAPDTDASLILIHNPHKGYALTLKGESFNFSSLFAEDTPKLHHFMKTQMPLTVSLRLNQGTTGKGKKIKDISATLKGHQGVEGLEWDVAHLSGVVGIGVPSNPQKNLSQPGQFYLSFENQRFVLQANDAGAFLKALGLHSELKGGSLILESKQNDPLKPYEGWVKIDDFEVKDMPILTRLLALSSPAGIIDFLSSKELGFSRFNAHFSTLNDQVIIHEARAVSAGLGIVFKGTLNQKNRTFYLTGNIIPAYMINSILSGIPLLGDLFFGGEDSGFLATRFTLKGPIDNPQIDVNPLYFLAPGFLKRLFEDNDEEERELRAAEKEMNRSFHEK